MLRNTDGSLSELHTKTNKSGVDLSDPDLSEAWAAVRDDGTDGTTFCVFSYKDKTSISCIGRGSGLKELQAMISEDNISYVGIRLDTSAGIRFLFLAIVGENVGGLAKGRAGMHKQAVYNFFEGVIGSVSVNSAAELTLEVLQGKIKDLTGGVILDSESATAAASASASAPAPAPAPASAAAPLSAPAPTPTPASSPAVEGAIFAFAELKIGCPAGVDSQHKEKHLSESEFQEIFGMNAASFERLPGWKQSNMKKQAGLF